VGDRIVSVNGEATETFVALQIAVDAALPAQSVRLTILRDGEPFEVTLSTEAMTVFDVFAGVEFTDLGIEYQRAGFTEGIALSSRQFVGYVQALVSVVRSVVAGQVEADEVFQGPVGVAQVLGESLRVGASYFFQLLAFLSLNFGLINLIPFPALDGSRAVFALYEWVRRKPIPPQREGIIHAIGFLILIGLMILITYQDIARLFG
jgi:regulator of sigma E protease